MHSLLEKVFVLFHHQSPTHPLVAPGAQGPLLSEDTGFPTVD